MTTRTMTMNADHASIDRSNCAFEAAIRKGDAAEVTLNYTEDARILPPNHPLATGKPTIHAYWQQVIDMGIKEILLETMDLEVLGDTAWEVGQAVMKTADNQVVAMVKYIIIWKRVSGCWLKHRGTWNSNG